MWGAGPHTHAVASRFSSEQHAVFLKEQHLNIKEKQLTLNLQPPALWRRNSRHTIIDQRAYKLFSK
jgi:hypothetical protein